jgi:endonuclease-3 related protein
VVVGAILTQASAWTNVEKAIANLKAAGVLSPGGILETPVDDLARLVHPAGYYNAKARKLRAFVEMMFERHAGELDRLFALPLAELRRELLATHGIGPETADAVMLYAAGQPCFVVDAYTRRVFGRLGLAPPPRADPPQAGARDDYRTWQRMFEEGLLPDVALFNEYHALIDRHAKTLCRKEPLCGQCFLREVCLTGRRGAG